MVKLTVFAGLEWIMDKLSVLRFYRVTRDKHIHILALSLLRADKNGRKTI